MSDRLPGSSWSNPIWYREKWRIYLGEPEYGHLFTFAYMHDDYDGAEDAHDTRHGYGATIEACKQEINREFYDEDAA